jgi:hypothetical protein
MNGYLCHDLSAYRILCDFLFSLSFQVRKLEVRSEYVRCVHSYQMVQLIRISDVGSRLTPLQARVSQSKNNFQYKLLVRWNSSRHYRQESLFYPFYLQSVLVQ